MTAFRSEFVAAIGAPGSGKSLYIKQTLARRRPPRLLIWDPQNEYGELAPRIAREGAHGPLSVLARDVPHARAFSWRYVCSDDWRLRVQQFGFFCALAFRAGDLVLVVDELGDVTSATLSLVPAWWSAVCRKGRHRGLVVMGGVQRPALVDKNFFGFATLIHCGRLNFADDVRTMDNVLHLRAAGGVALPGRAAPISRPRGDLSIRRPAATERVAGSVGELLPLEWIERDMTSGKLSAGRIAIPKRRAAAVPA